MVDPAHARRVDALFDRALDLPLAERAAFLDAATGGDAALRTEVEELLRLALDGGNDARLAPGTPLQGALLQAWAVDDADADVADEAVQAGGTIGGWHVLRPIGRGGMGAVHLVERRTGGFHQRGALKRLRAGMTGPEFLRRFAQERQILASLQHPGIARLLDGGDADGMPWLVMEYVDGEPIDAWCDARRLGIEARLALFAAICDAVAHAHRHLVVHRDLKPSNILVRADGTVALLDFGIAKVLDDTQMPRHAETRAALRLFTPEYAAPEQRAGEPVTTATDVYQLGLLLYELLAGARAGEALRAAPARPSSRVDARAAAARSTTPQALRRSLRGDLDTLVLAALRPEPERRYASVAALAEDVERWRQRRPLRARPDGFAYRTRKFLSRHPFGMAASTVALLLLVAYALTVTRQATALAAERDRARVEALKARQVQTLVLRLFEGADPERAGGARLTARELLDRGWSGIERELGMQPDVRADVIDTVGEAYRQLGEYDRARALFDEALAPRRTASGDAVARTARALRSRGRLASDEGEHARAQALLADALARYRRAPDAAAEVAATIADLGHLRFRMGDLDAAERHHRDALARRRALFGAAHAEVASSLDQLGTVLRHRGDYAGAEPLLRDALTLRRRLLPATHPLLASSLSNLAVTHVNLGRYDSAEALYREALARMAEARGARHPSVAMVMNNLAMLMQARREFGAAQDLLRQALDIRREAFGARHPEVAMNLNDLALALAEGGDADAAEAMYRQALAAYPADHPWRSATVFNLGMLAEKRGAYADAERHYREALARQRIDYGDDHERVGIDLYRIGIVLHRQGRLDEAETSIRQALAIFRKRLPVDHPRLALPLIPLGELLLDLGRTAEARAALAEAARVRRTAFGADDARTVEAVRALDRANATPLTPARIARAR